MTTPESPRRSYQGRVLPKQDEELVDQGLQFDITTLLEKVAYFVKESDGSNS